MFAKTIKISALIFVALTIIFTLIYQCNSNTVILSIAITFGTISYHFLMRLAVGYVVNGIFHNRFNYSRKWFQEKKFEKHLYEGKRLISGCTPEKCIPDLMLEIRNASVLLYFTLHSSFTLSFHGASFSSSSSDMSLLGLCSNRKFRYLYKSRP